MELQNLLIERATHTAAGVTLELSEAEYARLLDAAKGMGTVEGAEPPRLSEFLTASLEHWLEITRPTEQETFY